MDEILTPDFYEYAWTPITKATIDDRFLILEWADGTKLRGFDLWLRENAVSEGGVDPATREMILDPADHDPHTRMTSAEVTSDGAVVVSFDPEGATATFHPGWLRHVADRQHLAQSWIPDPEPWTTAEVAEPPSRDGTNVLTDRDVMRQWIDDMLRFGIARLRNLPTDPDFAGLVAGRIGAIRDTNFGHLWDVKADISMAGSADTNSTANTNFRLGPHTDLPTRETPPGFQFLHCIANTTSGGFSTIADGLAVVAELEANHPEHYDALTTLRWIFFNRGPGIDHRWSGPLIDHGVPGSPLTLRAFYPVRGFPDMDPADQPRAYEAMRVFSRLAASDRFQMRYPFEPGDMVGFDNRRILHGRDAYDTGGHRHLRGLYIDHDEVRSFARVANRHHAAEQRTQPTHSTQGAS
ncbi:MAG: TauD/TfdA family dioxygenase [Acidimicrobiales bacterium]